MPLSTSAQEHLSHAVDLQRLFQWANEFNDNFCRIMPPPLQIENTADRNLIISMIQRIDRRLVQETNEGLRMSRLETKLGKVLQQNLTLTPTQYIALQVSMLAIGKYHMS